jgi:hypothetical protein
MVNITEKIKEYARPAPYSHLFADTNTAQDRGGDEEDAKYET